MIFIINFCYLPFGVFFQGSTGEQVSHGIHVVWCLLCTCYTTLVDPAFHLLRTCTSTFMNHICPPPSAPSPLPCMEFVNVSEILKIIKYNPLTLCELNQSTTTKQCLLCINYKILTLTHLRGHDIDKSLQNVPEVDDSSTGTLSSRESSSWWTFGSPPRCLWWRWGFLPCRFQEAPQRSFWRSRRVCTRTSSREVGRRGEVRGLIQTHLRGRSTPTNKNPQDKTWCHTWAAGRRVEGASA